MPITVINQPILKITEGVILNNLSVDFKVSGIPLMLFVQWPILYENYKKSIIEKVAIGHMQGVRITPELAAINFYCEYVEQGVHTFSEFDFIKCLKKLNAWSRNPTNINKTIYVPRGLSSGDASASWEQLESLLNLYLPDANVCICTSF